MGRSQTCNFQCTVHLKNADSYPIYGAMTLKEVKGILLSENDYQNKKGDHVTSIKIFAQTKAGERYLKGYDYLTMDKYGKIHYSKIDTGYPLPSYD